MTNNILLLSLFLASIVIIALLSIHVSFVSRFTNAYSQALTIPKDYNNNDNDKQQQVKVIEATGHFANNQIENGSEHGYKVVYGTWQYTIQLMAAAAAA